MKESPNNIGMVCPTHAPKPSEQLASKPPESYIGKFVKKGFPTGMPKKMPQIEHMWVRIKRVDNGELVGELNNDPAFVDLKCGDTVRVRMEEIEQVLD